MTIDKDTLWKFLESKLEGTGYFPVHLEFSAGDSIDVEIDGEEPVDIDMCASLSRDIEEVFAPEIDDYDLTLGSAGLTSPFRTYRQYVKNIGNAIEVLTSDGKKLKGELLSADESGFVLGVETKVRKEGEKRPVIETVSHEFRYEDVKYAKYILQF